MNTVGSLVLLVSIGMLVVVGINATDSMMNEASATNDQTIVTQTQGTQSVISPIFMAFGFMALIIGAMVAISSFS